MPLLANNPRPPNVKPPRPHPRKPQDGQPTLSARIPGARAVRDALLRGDVREPARVPRRLRLRPRAVRHRARAVRRRRRCWHGGRRAAVRPVPVDAGDPPRRPAPHARDTHREPGVGGEAVGEAGELRAWTAEYMEGIDAGGGVM
jgi:hypothetical protein